MGGLEAGGMDGVSGHRLGPTKACWTGLETAVYIEQCVLGGSFIEPTPVKPGPALSSDVTP